MNHDKSTLDYITYNFLVARDENLKEFNPNTLDKRQYWFHKLREYCFNHKIPFGRYISKAVTKHDSTR